MCVCVCVCVFGFAFVVVVVVVLVDGVLFLVSQPVELATHRLSQC